MRLLLLLRKDLQQGQICLTLLREPATPLVGTAGLSLLPGAHPGLKTGLCDSGRSLLGGLWRAEASKLDVST